VFFKETLLLIIFNAVIIEKVGKKVLYAIFEN